MSVLRHHADLLRERRAPSRARLHDDRGRRAGPPHAPARRGRVLPHRHRRARRAGRAGGRARGHHAARARRPQRGPLQGARGQRSTPRTTSSSARPTPSTSRRSPRWCSGSTTTATSSRAPTRAGSARAAPTSRPTRRSRTATAARSTRSSSSGEEEDNWFFRLSAFQEPLERLYAERPDFVVPQERYNEALSFIQGGLQDLSLSRSRLKWGVPVPWDESQVVYVWIDALLNYYTALSYAREGEDLTDRFWPADAPPDRQGHPQVPRGDLAGAADGGRASRCRARWASTASSCSASTRCPSRSAT